MLKRDFIMVQIEELGKVIAQIIFNRNSNDGARKNPELIQSVYTSLKLDNDFLLNTPIDGIRTYLDGDDSCGLQRMELATKTLLEESFLLPEAQGKNSGQERKSYWNISNATTLRSHWNEWRCWKR
ncbi:hypothetical protein M5E82_10870 [Parabacteroides distasonis]|nr:hypothetical protein M5E82_10870 [Parabacteroides distasonis]